LAHLAGSTAARAARPAIEAGETSEDLYAIVGDDWDVEERARAWLDRLGLTHPGLHDRVERRHRGGASPPRAPPPGWSGSPAARPSWSRWPRCSCAAPASCCWTSRPTTWTWT